MAVGGVGCVVTGAAKKDPFVLVLLHSGYECRDCALYFIENIHFCTKLLLNNNKWTREGRSRRTTQHGQYCAVVLPQEEQQQLGFMRHSEFMRYSNRDKLN